MYHVNADNRFPYWVCGGQQESGSACVSSRGDWGEMTERDWRTVGAEEYGYVVPDPLHPGTTFGGKIEKHDERTDQTQEVSPIIRPSNVSHRAHQPLAFDHFDQRRLYFGANVVFATDERRQHWRVISPDLTRAHPGVPPVIGAFRNATIRRAATHRGVVYALAPSLRACRNDLGRHRRRPDLDHARRRRHWKNITPPELTPWSKSRRSTPRASTTIPRSSPSTAFARTISVRTSTSRTTAALRGSCARRGLPEAPVNAVRQIREVPDLLYAATENGVSVSFDDGATWQSLQINLPHTSVRDLDRARRMTSNVATHGRGFWILDDVDAVARARARRCRNSTRPTSLHPRTPIASGAARTPTRPCRRRSVGRESARRRDRRLLASPTARTGWSCRSMPMRRTARSALRERRRRARADSESRQAHLLGTSVRAALDCSRACNRFVWDLREPASARNLAGSAYLGGAARHAAGSTRRARTAGPLPRAPRG